MLMLNFTRKKLIIKENIAKLISNSNEFKHYDERTPVRANNSMTNHLFYFNLFTESHQMHLNNILFLTKIYAHNITMQMQWITVS